ncbi:MAG: ATP-binding protein [Mogibacterium sp.]|nr:ATP-binding protein [Mogibacterium sp.]
MRKRIFRAISLVTLLALVAFLVFIMGSTYEYFSGLQEQQLKNQVKLVANGAERSGIEYFDTMDVKGVRITWIASDGTVLYDNESSASEMENHLARPEVREAIRTGYGESSRYSSTRLEKQLYCAKRLKDGSVVRMSDSHSTVLTLLLGFAQPICLILMIVTLIAFVVASRVSSKIVEPINGIDLDDPLSTDTYNELDPLLNRLSAQQNQIRRDRAELEKTEHIRQEFTSNVSHEMKTPLHAISGYAELIRNGLVADEDVKPFASKIYDESKRMSQLVEDVIDLSKLDSGINEKKVEHTDLYRIAENAVESLESFAANNSVTLELEGESAMLDAVPHQLHSIVYNLCDNAIKYNREGGKVSIEVHDEAERVTLRVSDTGIGIPEESIDRVFERFYRVDKSHSREVGGTGLGLSIIKHAVAIHNGDINIESEVDKGTTITVTLPKKQFT